MQQKPIKNTLKNKFLNISVKRYPSVRLPDVMSQNVHRVHHTDHFFVEFYTRYNGHTTHDIK